MPSVIYTNTASLAAQRNLLGAQNSLTTSVERLSSGLRINRAKDDAAGLGVAESLQKQLNGIKQGIQNINDGISMAQTAEGALAAVSEMAQRMLTLATQGANETLSVAQRKSIYQEIVALQTAINDVSDRTKFTGNALFTGVGLSIQVSNDSGDKVQITNTALAKIAIDAGSNATLDSAINAATGLDGALTAATPSTTTITTKFQAVQDEVGKFLTAITTQRGELGAFQNQLEYTVANLTDFSTNLSAARSRVIDTDYAAETANLTKGQILQQAATAMLAQANQMPNVILTLLK
jgi:flagellin